MRLKNGRFVGVPILRVPSLHSCLPWVYLDADSTQTGPGVSEVGTSLPSSSLAREDHTGGGLHCADIAPGACL